MTDPETNELPAEIPCPRCGIGLRSGRWNQPEGPAPAKLCTAEHVDDLGPRYHCTEFTGHNTLASGITR